MVVAGTGVRGGGRVAAGERDGSVALEPGVLLQAVLDQLPSAVIATRPQGDVVLANARLAEIWGQPVELSSLLGEDPGVRAFTLDGRALAAGEWPLSRALRGETVVERLRILRGDGSDAVIDTYSGPVRDESGSLVAAAAA